jgi:hypothetical protein
MPGRKSRKRGKRQYSFFFEKIFPLVEQCLRHCPLRENGKKVFFLLFLQKKKKFAKLFLTRYCLRARIGAKPAVAVGVRMRRKPQ